MISLINSIKLSKLCRNPENGPMLKNLKEKSKFSRKTRSLLPGKDLISRRTKSKSPNGWIPLPKPGEDVVVWTTVQSVLLSLLLS